MVTYSELLSVAKNAYMKDINGNVRAVKLKDASKPKVQVEVVVYSDELREMTLADAERKCYAKNILYIQRTV